MQLLRSIETQQALKMPHRIIMPDTVVVHDDGAAELLPSMDPNPEYQPATAVDLKALAAVIHYAITKEMPAGGPLASRGLPGYSASLLEAVDRCLRGDRTQRPQSVDALRSLLTSNSPPPAVVPAAVGIAAVPEFVEPQLAPALSAAPPQLQPELHIAPETQRAPEPQLMQEPKLVPEPKLAPEPQLAPKPQIAAEPQPQLSPQIPPPQAPLPPTSGPTDVPPHRKPRLLLAGLAALILAAAGYGLYEMGRLAGAAEQRSLTMAAAPAVAPAAAPVNPDTPAPAQPPAPAADLVMLDDVEGSKKVADAPAADAPVADATPAAEAAPADTSDAQNAQGANTTYKLLIKPWGTVYVDGVERGVSPPLTYLKLTAGQHTIAIENPGYPNRVIVVNAGKNKWGRIAHDFRRR